MFVFERQELVKKKSLGYDYISADRWIKLLHMQHSENKIHENTVALDTT